MKSALKWGSLCLLVYFIFLIIKLPAVHVLSKIQLDKGMGLNGVSGTIWNGHAQSLYISGVPVTDVDWSLSFFPLLVGKISLDIKAGNIRDTEQISATGFVQLSFSGHEIHAQEFLVYLPTKSVLSLVPLPIPVKADGRFKVQLDDLDYSNGCQTLSGQGQWLNASYTNANKEIDLGNFDADLSCKGTNILLNINEPNSFGLSAEATIPANMKFKIAGRFKPDANLPKEVHQAAQFFGKPDDNGYYPIKF